MAIFTTNSTYLKRFLKITGRIFLVILLLLLALWGFLETNWGQNWLAGQVTSRLSKDLQTHISIQHIRLGFFDKLDMEGVYIADQKKDTLLYAGELKVRITDWFFFKDKADLKYIGLNNAKIYLNRTDSVWNYHFLETYFTSTDTSTKKSAGIHFDLQQVEMNHVVFEQKDKWAGSDLHASVGSLVLQADKIGSKEINIRDIVLQDPYFSLLGYKGNRPFVPASTGSSDPATLQVHIAHISLRNGRFRDDQENLLAPLHYFDSRHMDFTSINGDIKEFTMAGDILSAHVDISTKEHSGLEVRELNTDYTLRPDGMIFDKLSLKLNKSTITHYFAMHYAGIGSLDSFLHAVKLDADFSQASISSDDIAFFAPDVKAWNKTIRLNGRIRGSVDNLSSKDLEVWAGKNTYIHGNISLIGLPNINETLINLEAKDFRTTYTDAASFVPSLRTISTPNLSKLSFLHFSGNYTGFVNDFVLFGSLKTNLGTLVTDLNMKFPAKGAPEYSGKLSTAGFQLGSFINSPTIGLVDFHGNVKGKSFTWQNLEMNLDGLIHHIQLGNYTYQNIAVKGNFSKRKFNGDLLMNDENADLHIKGLVDLTGIKPIFDVQAEVNHANLKNLQITNEDYKLSGNFNLNMEGSSISDILGTARISNAQLLHNGKALSFDSLSVNSTFINGVKTLTAISNEFNAKITGNFNIDALPNSVAFFLNRYYPSYIHAPANALPQAFSFDITTGMVEDYIKLLDPHLSGFNNSHITGSLNSTGHSMTIDADVPQFSFKEYSFSDIKVKGSGDYEKLQLTGNLTNAQIGDSLIFPETNFNIEAAGDVSKIQVNTSANQAINQANIAAQVNTFSDGAIINFNPSSFVLNGKTWSIEKGGELNFRKNTVVQGQVILRESEQTIRLWTTPSDIGSWNDLHVSIQKLNIGDVSPFFMGKDRLEGLLNAELTVENPQDQFNLTGKIETQELQYNTDSVGRLTAQIGYNKKTGLLTGKGENADPDHHLDFDLLMHLKDSLNVNDHITLRPTHFQLNFLELFLGDIFSNIQGYVTGNVDIKGGNANRSITARARLEQAAFKVNFTQVSYKIDDADFEMKKDTIDFTGHRFRIRDSLGNTAILDGMILHDGFFGNMFYDLSVQTESRQMLLINTTYKDNQEFFGRAKGSGSFILNGPQDDLFMEINARASATDSSYITLPPSKTRESGQANFMIEKKYGREMNDELNRSSHSNLTYDVSLTATPLVNIEVILDELTGDVVRTRGSGNLRMVAGTSTPLTLNGTYYIQEGNYLFTFQSFFKKPFILSKGANNFITWNGDPNNAIVHLDAVYTAENVSFAPIAGAVPINNNSINLSNLRDNVNVVATMTGQLFHPELSFRLEFPSNSAVFNNPDVSFGLQQIQKNPNELNKQVASLIVFNSFTPPENLQSTSFNPFGEFAYSTISGLLFGEVNKRLNQLLSKVLNNNRLTFNFTGSLYDRNLVSQSGKGSNFKINQSDLNLSLGLPLFNDRAHFTVGGNFDVPINSDIQQTIRLLPDVTLAIDLNKSGSLSATFFYRQNIDYFYGSVLNGTSGTATRRYGARVSYGREFDNLKEFFNRRRRKPAPKDTLQAVKPDPVSGQ